ncbi:hypothetical protein Cme02nite_00780 [Catellatospora methionotrophica]|uniref:DUF11 domain-containing protein n=1 Tax=Catellatospora methionotrophica TaxID=121620 RepID=A0A8J3PBU8_9ACTN|nr:hypothetical protein [Catellatospora methionotrophica]GIG11746.1 hypothetical protein Cme02nite_00780 [Catellatospora methionotrophica]
MRHRLRVGLAALLCTVASALPSTAHAAAASADLALSNVPSAVTTGARVMTSVKVTVRNQGSATAEAYLAVTLEGGTGRVTVSSMGGPAVIGPGEQKQLTAVIMLRPYAKTGFAGTMVVDVQGGANESTPARVKVSVGVPRNADVVVSGNRVAQVAAGQTAVFRYTVTNRGPMEVPTFELTMRGSGFEVVRLVGCTKLSKSSFRCRADDLAPGRSLRWEMHLRFAKPNADASGGVSVLVAERCDDTNVTNSDFGFEVRAGGAGAAQPTKTSAGTGTAPAPTPTAVPSASEAIETSVSPDPAAVAPSAAAALLAGTDEPRPGSPTAAIVAVVLALALGASVGFRRRARLAVGKAAEPKP